MEEDDEQMTMGEYDELDEKTDNPSVLKRYGMGSKIVDEVMNKLVVPSVVSSGSGEGVSHVNVLELCEKTDSVLLGLLSKLLPPNQNKNKKKKKKKKEDVVVVVDDDDDGDDDDDEVSKVGISFPTSISTGRIIGSFSPERGETREIKPGDEVRIEMGVHVDGYISIVGTTLFVPFLKKKGGMLDEGDEEIIGEEDTEMFERRETAMFCARKVLELTMKAMTPGSSNLAIGKLTNQLLDKFGVKFLNGILSHEMSRYVMDGINVILHNPTPSNQVFEFKFKNNQVYCIDIGISTNPKFEGKLKEEDYNPCLLKRELLLHPVFLKSKTATKLLRHIDDTYDSFPFPQRKIEIKDRIGLNELKMKGFITALPIFYRRKKEDVVRIISTVSIQNGKVVQLTEPFFQKKYLNHKPKVSLSDRKLKDVKEILTK